MSEGEADFEVCVLGSGSRGNAVLVRGGGRTVLIDAGFSVKSLRERAQRAGWGELAIDAILITHEHTDHVQHAARTARAFDAPILVNAPTRAASEKHLGDFKGSLEEVPSDRAFSVEGFDFEPWLKSHDAAAPVSLFVRRGASTFGCVTDLGVADEGLPERLGACHALMFESNHDPLMLSQGPYPLSVRRRVGGREGHLSNEDAARLLARSADGRLGCVVLSHLSGQNNAPARVRDAFLKHAGADPGYARFISRQDAPSRILTLSSGTVTWAQAAAPVPPAAPKQAKPAAKSDVSVA